MKNLTPHFIGGLLAFAIPVIIFCSCDNVKKTDDFYRNIKAVIISKGGYAEKNGKVNNQGNTLLIRSLSDTTMYTELSGHNWDGLDNCYGNKLFWTKKVGDTLHFDYILKSRFWRELKPLQLNNSPVETSQLKILDSVLKETQIRTDKMISVAQDLVKHTNRLTDERDSLIRKVDILENKLRRHNKNCDCPEKSGY